MNGALKLCRAKCENLENVISQTSQVKSEPKLPSMTKLCFGLSVDISVAWMCIIFTSPEPWTGILFFHIENSKHVFSRGAEVQSRHSTRFIFYEFNIHIFWAQKSLFWRRCILFHALPYEDFFLKTWFCYLCPSQETFANPVAWLATSWWHFSREGGILEREETNRAWRRRERLPSFLTVLNPENLEMTPKGFLSGRTFQTIACV